MGEGVGVGVVVGEALMVGESVVAVVDEEVE